MSAREAIILVTPRSFGAAERAVCEELESVVGTVRYNDLGRPLTAAELRERLVDVDALLAGLDDVDASVFAAAPRLRVVARYGVGVDRVDLEAAARHGVTVTTTPGANANAVAELAIALMLAASRRLPAATAAVRRGDWPVVRGRELAGRTVGVVGVGAIGARVAERARGLGCRVIGHDPLVASSSAVDELVALDELMARSDVVTLHLPLTEQTAGLIGDALLAHAKPDGLLVNTARGELIDEAALVRALDAGRLGGAALDTLAGEPPAPGHPLLDRDDVIVTPHAGPHTIEAMTAMARMAIADLVAVLDGRAPRHEVAS